MKEEDGVGYLVLDEQFGDHVTVKGILTLTPREYVDDGVCKTEFGQKGFAAGRFTSSG